MFVTRLISGIVLIVLMAAMMYLGGMPLLMMLFAFSLIALFELYRGLKIEKSAPAVISYLFTVVYYLLLALGVSTEILLIMLLPVLMIVYVVTFPKYNAEKLAYVFMGFYYCALMLSFIYKVRMDFDNGHILVWLVFLGSWGSDTCAYCVGMLIGKHKVFPVLSPKKSAEGCVGGVLGAALLGFLYALIFKDGMTAFSNPLVAAPVVTGCSAVLSQIGDLAASAIKRNYNIKDYGKLIPGHGGIMDRFDSVIFVAPVIYCLLLVL